MIPQREEHGFEQNLITPIENLKLNKELSWDFSSKKSTVYIGSF